MQRALHLEGMLEELNALLGVSREITLYKLGESPSLYKVIAIPRWSPAPRKDCCIRKDSSNISMPVFRSPLCAVASASLCKVAAMPGWPRSPWRIVKGPLHLQGRLQAFYAFFEIAGLFTQLSPWTQCDDHARVMSLPMQISIPSFQITLCWLCDVSQDVHFIQETWNSGHSTQAQNHMNHIISLKYHWCHFLYPQKTQRYIALPPISSWSLGPPCVPHRSSWMDLWQRSQDTALIWIKSSTEKRRPAYSKKPSLGLGGNPWKSCPFLAPTSICFSNKHMINTLKAAPNIDFPSNQPNSGKNRSEIPCTGCFMGIFIIKHKTSCRTL